MTVDDVDAIAFTRGPGMYGCLAVGAASAQALAAAAGKPLIGIHHMVCLIWDDIIGLVLAIS